MSDTPRDFPKMMDFDLLDYLHYNSRGKMAMVTH